MILRFLVVLYGALGLGLSAPLYAAAIIDPVEAELLRQVEAEAKARQEAAVAPVPANQPVLEAPELAQTDDDDAFFGKVKGYTEVVTAITYDDDVSVTVARSRTELVWPWKTEGVKGKISVRVDLDAAYLQKDRYPSEVRKDQLAEVQLRQAYADFSVGDFDIRAGKQFVGVWGELIGGASVADLSAFDFREFIMPDTDVRRRSSWAVSGIHTFGNSTVQAFVSLPTVHDFGKPGSNFFPLRHVPATFLSEQKPRVSDLNLGIRASHLFKNGWDVSGFAVSRVDPEGVFARASDPRASLVLQRQFGRIHEFGGTASKPLADNIIGKGEAKLTKGKEFSSLDPWRPRGVVRHDVLTTAVALDINLPGDVRVTPQLVHRQVLGHDAATLAHRSSTLASLLATKDFGNKVKGEVLVARALERSDFMAWAKLSKGFAKDWEASVQATVFGGRATGIFGPHAKQDQIGVTIRKSF